MIGLFDPRRFENGASQSHPHDRGHYLPARPLRRHQITLKTDFDALPNVSLDKHKVIQILVNLIINSKNALSFRIPSDRIITMHVKKADDNRAQIIVEDNGEGIAAENIDRIFQHGFTTRENGHGFGLHSAANAARELGGTLTVRSDGQGQGAKFVLEIPMAPQNGQDEEEQEIDASVDSDRELT